MHVKYQLKISCRLSHGCMMSLAIQYVAAVAMPLVEWEMKTGNAQVANNAASRNAAARRSVEMMQFVILSRPTWKRQSNATTCGYEVTGKDVPLMSTRRES